MSGSAAPAGAAPDTRPPATLACCGLIGTVIADNGLTERAFSEAIATQGVVTGTGDYARAMALVHRTRGQAAGAVLAALFPGNAPRAQAAHLAFERSLASAVDRIGVSAVPGAREALAELAAGGLRICVLTGLSVRLSAAVLRAVGWAGQGELVLSGDEVPRGFPAPDLVLTAMLRAGVGDVREAVVADCAGDAMAAGRAAGAGLTVGLLSGPHSRERLKRDGASVVIDSIAGLPVAVLPRGQSVRSVAG